VGSKMMGLQDSDTDNSSLYLWLYGVTLFRQSRHTNALISEAIFPCPHRFNIEGRDNDIERHKIVFSKKSGWLPELAGEGVFYRKPGGYTWKYNDMRLGLQYFLESISEVKVPKGNKGEFVKVYSLWHLRPRIHFWIGDWYIRAFYATGHYSPVCETIHHSIQALMLSRYYLPAHEGVEDNSKSRAVFFARLRLGLRSINQARLILSLGTNSLKFWCAGSDLRQTNFFCRNEGTEITSYLESIRLDFKINGTKIYGRYGIEDSVIFTKFMNQWQCLIQDFDRVIDEVSSEGRIESVNGMSSVEQTVSGSRVNEPYLSQNWELIASSSWRNELDSDLSDCLENNRKVLKKFFSKLEAQNSSWLTGKWSRNLVEIWLSGFKGRDGDLINLIQIMLGYSLHYFNRGEYFLLDRQHSWQSVITSVEDVAKRYWSTASAFSYLTLDLCRYISCESLEQMSKFRFRALTTYSLCLSKLSRFQESHRRLNEAHAFLSRGECRFNDSDLARVNLVRSGVYMDQCINRMVNRHQKERVEIAECYPFLGDCWVSIERAEHVMSGKVHSSSLWFQLVEAKLKCYALSGLLLERRECRESERRCNSILFRKRVDKPSLLLGLLRRGLLLSEGCVYRQSLLFLYFCFSAFNVKPDELEMLISVVRAWHNDEISPVVGDLEKSISDLNSGENPFERRKIDDVVSRVLDRFNTGRNPSGDLPTN
ncbi:MAG: hypothetical protein P1V20_30320, partial [Verrucomicrobiales bacterium]|nr:hypothetical protein [Verrucomicrobiales bacterium]